MDLSRHPDVWDESTLYADDLAAGQVFALGSHTVSTAELTSFATTWDPQFFHVDPDAAENGLFDGLIASGIHTLAVFQRLSVAAFWGRAATVAARGIREVRFLRPMRPETTLVGRLTIEDVSHRDATRSLVSVSGRLDEESGGQVLSMSVDAYLARRPGRGPSTSA
jgi:acyl dehydratase